MKIEELFNINEKDWYKIISWAKIAYDEDKNEISGLATAVPAKDNKFIISDVEILKQENTGTNTELDGDAVANYKMKYAMKYKNPGIKFVWWHSHHTMGAFWSGTDEKEIEAWKNESFSLALVVNLKQEYKFRVSIWKASGLDIEEHYDTTLNIIRKDGVKITDAMKKQYDELCSNKTHTHINHGYSNMNQRTLWGNTVSDKVAMKDRTYYKQTTEAIDEIINEFMQGETSVKSFKKNLNELQKSLDKFNITDYKILIPKGNKHELIEKLQFVWDVDILEFKDEMLKREYEEGDYYGWYN